MENSSKLFNSLRVTCHTDFVASGSTFVAINGTKLKGVDYISSALAKGATQIVVEATEQLVPELLASIAAHGASLTYVTNARAALAELSAQAYNYPAEKLKIIGITGTKGKTTSAWLVEHVMRTAGCKTALISTVCNKINGVQYNTTLTTPQPDYIQAFLHECVQHGIDVVIIESAAQAFTLHRLDRIRFDAAIFTNFSLEHSEFYATQEAYWQAKLQIIDHLKPSGILFANGDDATIQSITHQSCRFFGVDSIAQLQASNVITNKHGIACDFMGHHFATDRLFGRYNLYNMLGVIAVARSCGLSNETVAHALTTFTAIPGRMQETVKQNGVRFIIDYAHNPASFTALLASLAERTDHLIILFGAGGERGHDRRPLMGAIAAQYAQQVIITTDNPRSENPGDIIQDIVAGIPQEKRACVTIEPDRKKAIEYAYTHAHPGSIVALLGKGPDEYQLVNGIKTYFSEQEIVNGL